MNSSIAAKEKMSKDHIGSESVTTCPLCGARKRTIRHKNLEDRWFGTPGKWTLKQCDSCSLVYLDPRPVAEDVGKTYSIYYTHQIPTKEHHRAIGIGASLKSWIKFSFKMIYRFVRTPMRLMERNLYTMHLSHREPGCLLDVGCGNGRFLKCMRELGWKVQGVEIDPQSARVAEETFGLTVRVGTLENANYPDNSFDAVTMSHVIEHLYEPVRILTECRRILKQGGILVVATPNIESIGHWWFGRAWRGLEPPRHLQVFSRKTLRVCAIKAGFQAIETWTTAARAEFPFFLLSVKARDSLSGKDGMVNEEQPSSIYHRFQSMVFFFVELVANFFVPSLGEEVVLRARK